MAGASGDRAQFSDSFSLKSVLLRPTYSRKEEEGVTSSSCSDALGNRHCVCPSLVGAHSQSLILRFRHQGQTQVLWGLKLKQVEGPPLSKRIHHCDCKIGHRALEVGLTSKRTENEA